MEGLVNRLRAALLEILPGQTAQYKMAPRHRAAVPTSEADLKKYKPSAVMILFCEDENGDVFIPLIERMPYKGAHSAQISFPGGKFDEQDGDLAQTAIRECYEEIGVSDIEIVGKLTELHIPVSGFVVYPYIGFCRKRNPAMDPHVREVKSVLKLELQALLKEEIVRMGQIYVHDDLSIESPWYEIAGHRVWGATAMILSELKDICRAIS